MEFADSWLWLIILAAGMVFIILELLIGVETGLDLVIVGSVFVIGGLVTWPTESWIVTAIVVSLISLAYLVFGRKYVHSRMLVKEEKTNIDAIVGKTGIVLQPITAHSQGLVKVGYEDWRASANEDIPEGDEIVVRDITGVTLSVEKKNGGIK